MPRKGTLRTCPKGHRYYKSTGCPTCPVCEQTRKPDTGFLSMVSAPARRALERENITTLKDLAKWSEAALLLLHGIGPSAIPPLKKAMAHKALNFKKDL